MLYERKHMVKINQHWSKDNFNIAINYIVISVFNIQCIFDNLHRFTVVIRKLPGHNFTLAINLLYLYSFLFEISCIYFDSLIFWQLVKITLKFWNPSIFFLHECTGKSQNLTDWCIYLFYEIIKYMICFVIYSLFLNVTFVTTCMCSIKSMN